MVSTTPGLFRPHISLRFTNTQGNADASFYGESGRKPVSGQIRLELEREK